MTPAADARIFVTGATGLIGDALCRELCAEGAEVVALSRRPRSAAGVEGLRFVVGDVTTSGPWQREIAGTDAVVHLAGESIVAGRWTGAVKEELQRSRIEGTRCIVEAMAASERPPAVLVCASGTGYYGPRGEEELDETAAPGRDFLARLCVDWEAEAHRVETLGRRAVCLRFGMVLSAEGGALARMLPPFRLGLGGPLGPKDRFTPWIHVQDAVGLIRFALQESGALLSGPVNAVGPEAVRMGAFVRTLGRVLGRPSLLPVPTVALRLILGEAADAIVPGQRVVPRAALDAGYPFVHPTLRGAFEHLLG